MNDASGGAFWFVILAATVILLLFILSGCQSAQNMLYLMDSVNK